MALIQNIILAIVVIVVVVLIYNYFRSNKTHLSGLKSAKSSVKIQSKQLPHNKGSNNFAYSIWFYVSDWQYRLTEQKEILSRSSNSTKNNYNPKITLAPYENNININISTYPVSGEAQQNDSKQDDSNLSHVQSNHDCVIRNFPLQRWVNLIISLNGRTLDVYLDGKLVRTCILPGVAKPFPDSDINITPEGGFSGWTSNLQYWSNPLNPQEAYDVYKNGYGGNSIGSFFNKYKVKISYLVNNIEEGSFSV